MASADKGYRSRKFITTNHAMLLGAGMMVFGAFKNPPDGFWMALSAFFILLGTGIASYNWANLRESQNGSAPMPRPPRPVDFE